MRSPPIPLDQIHTLFSPPQKPTKSQLRRRQQKADDCFRQEVLAIGAIFAERRAQAATGARREAALNLLARLRRDLAGQAALRAPRRAAPRRVGVRRHRRAARRAQKTGTDGHEGPEPPPSRVRRLLDLVLLDPPSRVPYSQRLPSAADRAVDRWSL